MAKVHKRYTRDRLAVALCNRQNKTGLEVFTKRLDEAFVEKEALEKQLEEVKAQYNQVINFVAGKDAYDRVLSRRKACQKARKCSREEANNIILKRTQVPATLEHIDEVQKKYLETKADHIIPATPSEYDLYQDQSYQCQMNWVMRKLHRIPAYRQYSLDQVEQFTKQYMKELVNNSAYMFRCSAKNFNLIANDKMKTQMEVGSSGGMMNTNYRKAFSEQTFGVKSKQLDNTEYENYGYLGSKVNQLQTDSPTRQYGNIAVRLNKERMKNRVTCTFGDSLDNQTTARAQRIEDAGMGCVGMRGKLSLAQYAISAATSRLKLPPSESDTLAKQLDLGYLELQYHGDVTARDMDEVVAVRPKYRFRADISQESKDKALQELDGEFTMEMSSAFLKVQDINEHPEHYGRTGMPPLSFLVVDGDKVEKLI